MEHRANMKIKAFNEIKELCKEMACAGFVIMLLGILGLIIFHYTGKYLIHPALYFIIIPAGFFMNIVAFSAYINSKKKMNAKQFWMTKNEALKALKNGQRIAHQNFGNNIYLYMEYDIIYTSDGTNYDFMWDNLTLYEWQKGWRIINN